MSLERKLSLLLAAVVAVILVITLILTKSELTSSAERATTERMTRSVQGIATGTETGVLERSRAVMQAARDPQLVRQLASGAATPTIPAFTALRTRDSTNAHEIWTRDGTPVVHDGRPIADAERAMAFADLPALLARAARTDSAVITRFYEWGGDVHFWRVARVRDGRRTIGFLAVQGRATSPRGAVETMRAVLGDPVLFHLRNADGDFWAAAPGTPTSRPVRRDSTATARYDILPDGRRMLVAEAPIRGTPWLAVLHNPAEVVLGPVRTIVLRLALAGILLALIGSAIAYAYGVKVSRPVVALTEAAEQLARGERSGRVPVQEGDEVGRLGAAFNNMADRIEEAAESLRRRTEEAERANRAKADFLAMMSHELRTPLNAISGYSDLLTAGVYGPLTPKQADALARIARNQEHLLTLINSVLQFARIDAGQVQYDIRPVSVMEVVHGLEPLIEPQALAKNLGFSRRIHAGLVVRADTDKLRQVLINLLANAIKFTPAGGHISVEAEGGAETVHIRVADTGSGIAPDHLPRVFDPFVQEARALNRPQEGVGLGLAISRDLVRGMGGELTATSVLGQGSTFTVTLPRGEPAAPVPVEGGEEAVRGEAPAEPRVPALEHHRNG